MLKDILRFFRPRRKLFSVALGGAISVAKAGIKNEPALRGFGSALLVPAKAPVEES